jgi:hypothetical protein
LYHYTVQIEGYEFSGGMSHQEGVRASCLQEISLIAMSTVISLFPSHENLRGGRLSEHEYETTVILLTCANDRGCM